MFPPTVPPREGAPAHAEALGQDASHLAIVRDDPNAPVTRLELSQLARRLDAVAREVKLYIREQHGRDREWTEHHDGEFDALRRTVQHLGDHVHTGLQANEAHLRDVKLLLTHAREASTTSQRDNRHVLDRLDRLVASQPPPRATQRRTPWVTVLFLVAVFLGPPLMRLAECLVFPR